MISSDPSGFILSDSAMYAFQCQDVYPDLLSFAVAIPDHLKPIFLIPISIQTAHLEPSDKIGSIASRVADIQLTPTGDSDASELFSYQSFVNYDNETNTPAGDEGSVYHSDLTPDNIPVSQPGDQFCDGESRYDARVWNPDSPSFMTDGDSTDLFYEGYPYRTNYPVRHSHTKISITPIKARFAIKPEILQEHAPDKIRENAGTCTTKFVSYHKPTRMYTFSVHCGNVPHMVRAILSEIDEITMTCDCPFWRWGGPEYHAKVQKFLFGKPRGTAESPNVRDPDRKYWLCKHAYSVLRHLKHHVQKVIDEHWDMDDQDLLDVIDSEWDRLNEEVEIPIEQIESTDVEIEPESEIEVEFEEEPEEEIAESDLEELIPEEEPEDMVRRW
jgi:hypothetical protein